MVGFLLVHGRLCPLKSLSIRDGQVKFNELKLFPLDEPDSQSIESSTIKSVWSVIPEETTKKIFDALYEIMQNVFHKYNIRFDENSPFTAFSPLEKKIRDNLYHEITENLVYFLQRNNVPFEYASDFGDIALVFHGLKISLLENPNKSELHARFSKISKSPNLEDLLKMTHRYIERDALVILDKGFFRVIDASIAQSTFDDIVIISNSNESLENKIQKLETLYSLPRYVAEKIVTNFSEQSIGLR